MGGWVGLRAGLDDMEKREILDLAGTRTPNPSVLQPVSSRYTDYTIPAPSIVLMIVKCILRQSFNVSILFVVYFTTSSVSQAIKRRMVGTLANNEVGRIWKEAGRVLIEALPGHLPEGLRKITKYRRVADVLAEIRIEHHPNTNLERYRYACATWYNCIYYISKK
jgi:hypothetical protein